MTPQSFTIQSRMSAFKIMEITMEGTRSLNLTTAAGIVMREAVRQRAGGDL